MENQHKKIKGYRDLTAEEIGYMNDIKRIEAELITLVNKLNTLPDDVVRKRDLAVGKTNLQTGFMWTVRSVAKPEEIPHYTQEEKSNA